MALPQRHRLRGRHVFDALYRRGRALHGAAIVLRWMPDQNPLPRQSDLWRCSVVVSTKVHKRAVQRNRLRRLLQQAVRQQLQDFCGPPLWLLISLKPGSASWEQPRLLEECNHLLSKAGLTPCRRSPSPADPPPPSELKKPSSTKGDPPAAI